MMQDWANRLDLLELGEVGIASRHLVVHLQGLPEVSLPRNQASHGSRMRSPYFEMAYAPAMSSSKEAKAIQHPRYPQQDRSKPEESQEAAGLVAESCSGATELLKLDEAAFSAIA